MKRRSRRHYVDAFKEKFFLRFHMTMLMVTVYFFGVGVDWSLYAAHVRNVPLRYGLAMLAAYAFSFVVLRLWLSVVVSHPEVVGQKRQPHASLDGDDLADLGEAVVDVVSEIDLSSSGSGASSGGGLSDIADIGDIGDADEGIFVVIALIIIFALVALLGGYLLWEAPNILAEAAFQAAIAGAIARPSRKLERRVAAQDDTLPRWSVAFFRGTIIPFALAWALVVGGAALAVSECPDADRASDIKACLFAKTK